MQRSALTQAAVQRLSTLTVLPLEDSERHAVAYAFHGVNRRSTDGFQGAVHGLTQLLHLPWEPHPDEVQAVLLTVRLLSWKDFDEERFLRMASILKSLYYDYYPEELETLDVFVSLGGQPDRTGWVDARRVRELCETNGLQLPEVDQFMLPTTPQPQPSKFFTPVEYALAEKGSLPPAGDFCPIDLETFSRLFQDAAPPTHATREGTMTSRDFDCPTLSPTEDLWVGSFNRAASRRISVLHPPNPNPESAPPNGSETPNAHAMTRRLRASLQSHETATARALAGSPATRPCGTPLVNPTESRRRLSQLGPLTLEQRGPLPVTHVPTIVARRRARADSSAATNHREDAQDDPSAGVAASRPASVTIPEEGSHKPAVKAVLKTTAIPVPRPRTATDHGPRPWMSRSASPSPPPAAQPRAGTRPSVLDTLGPHAGHPRPSVVDAHIAAQREGERRQERVKLTRERSLLRQLITERKKSTPLALTLGAPFRAPPGNAATAEAHGASLKPKGVAEELLARWTQSEFPVSDLRKGRTRDGPGPQDSPANGRKPPGARPASASPARDPRRRTPDRRPIPRPS